MTTIHKFPLKITDLQSVTMPKGALILDAQFQNGTLCLWAEVDPNETFRPARRFEIIGTGNPIPDGSRIHIATVQEAGFVWHVFERLI